MLAMSYSDVALLALILAMVCGSVSVTAVFVTEWIRWRGDGGTLSSAVKSVSDKAKSLVTKEEKSEYMPPMNDEEYEKWQDDLAGRKGLMEKIDEKAPWK